MNKKAKSDYGIVIIIVGGIILLTLALNNNFHLLGSITGSETISRSAPTTVNPGSTFTLSYQANSVSGTWGASLTDSVSGGCTILGKSSISVVMVSDLPNPLTYTVQAPSSGSCVFTGDYQFGSSSLKQMGATTVNVCTASCNRPSNSCTQAASVSNGCGGNCAGSWSTNQVTSDDTDCNGKVDRNELGVAINGWIAGSVSRTQLGQDIQSWSS